MFNGFTLYLTDLYCVSGRQVHAVAQPPIRPEGPSAEHVGSVRRTRGGDRGRRLPAADELHHGTTRGEHHADQQWKGTYTVPFTTCNLTEENTTPISNGKVRTLFHSLPEENATPITSGKVRTLFHLADKLHHRTTKVEHCVNQ